MSRPAVQIKVSYAGEHTLGELSRTLQARMKYLNESAFQAIHATAVNALTSIRSGTRVAKAAGIKVDVRERTDLVFSYTTEGGGGFKDGSRSERKLRRAGFGISVRRSDAGHRKMCLRTAGGSRFTPETGTAVRYLSVYGVPAKTVKVFEFVDDDSGRKSTYLLVAKSTALAKQAAREIVARRLLRYAGLARRAVSALMVKTNNKGPADAVNARVFAKANEVTAKREVIAKGKDGGGKYALLLYDDLRYAARALNGGQAAVDLALKKAMNKTVSVIQTKCKNLLLPGELPLPFPEVSKRGAA